MSYSIARAGENRGRRSHTTRSSLRVMDLTALLSTPGAAAVVTVAGSTLTLWLANRQASRVAERQLQEDRIRLRFEARERRYEDRKNAVIEFDRVVEREATAIEITEMDPQTGYSSPGEIFTDYRFQELTAAHTHVVMLATPEVVLAADELRDAIVATFFEKEGWSRYRTALPAYRNACRAMLADDAYAEA